MKSHVMKNFDSINSVVYWKFSKHLQRSTKLLESGIFIHVMEFKACHPHIWQFPILTLKLKEFEKQEVGFDLLPIYPFSLKQVIKLSYERKPAYTKERRILVSEDK